MEDNKDKKERKTLSDSDLEKVAGGESFNAVGMARCIQKYFKDHPEQLSNPDRHNIATQYCFSIGANRPN